MTLQERALDIGFGLALAAVTFLGTLAVLLSLAYVLILEPMANAGWQP